MAGRSLGTLTLDLIAKVGGFEEGMDKGGKAAAKWRSQVEKDAKAVGTAIGAATAVATAALTAMAVQTVNSAKEISKLSSVSGLDTTSFQKYAEAAKLVGVEQDKLADIFKDTNDKIGDFMQTGAGPMADFFENIAPKVGVTAQQFSKLSGPQALGLYVSSLEKANLSQSEMTFYMEAIASDATLLLPLLKNNSEGFKMLGDMAEQAGAIMDQSLVDTATRLEAAMIVGGQAADGLKNQLMTGLLPSVANVAEAMLDVSVNSAIAEDAGRTLGTILQWLGGIAAGVYASFDLVGRSIATFASTVAAADIDATDLLIPGGAGIKVAQNFEQVKAAFNQGAQDLEERALQHGNLISKLIDGPAPNSGKSKVEDLAKLLAQLRSNADAAGKSLVGTGQSAGVLAKKTADAAKEVDALIKKYAPLSNAEKEREVDMAAIEALYLTNTISAEQYQEAVQNLWKAQNQSGWDTLNKNLAAQKKSLEDTKQQADSVADMYDKEGAAVRKLAEERKRLQKAIEDGLDTDGRYAKALKEVDKEQQKLAKSTGVWADLTAEAFERVSERGADMWEEFLDTGKFSFDSLLDVAKKWAAEMLNAMTIKPILTSLGNWLTNSDNPGGIGDVFGGLFGGGSGSSGSGGGMGGLFNMAKNIYSIYDTITGVGTAAYTGFQTGGFSGALSSIGSHYADSMLGQAYNTVTGWFTGAAAEATAQAAANAASSAAAQAAGQAAGNSLAVNAGTYAATSTVSTGFLSGIMSSIGSSLSNPYTWALAGALTSGKLYDAGVRLDADAMRESTRGNVIGDIWTEFPAQMTNFYKGLDAIFEPIVGGKTAAMITGSSLHQAIWTTLNQAIFGKQERFKTTVGSAVGSFSGDEYTGMGASPTWFNGTRKFGEDVDQALHDLNETFSKSLSSIFDRFGIDETIETEARVRLRRTSGKLATDFFATIGDDMIKVGGQFAKGGDVRKGLSMFFDVVMGEGIAKAIAVSDLPQYLKDLTNGLKKAEEVSSAIDGLFQRFDTTNATIEQMGFSAFELTDKGLRAADALLDMSAALGGLENATSADKIGAFGSLTQSYMDAFVPAQDKYAAQLKGLRATFEALDETIPATRKGFMDLVTGLDLTTEEGRAAFATYMSLSEAMGSYYSNMEGLQANYLAAFGSSLEQQRQAYAALTAEFSKLGVQMPNTREGFRDLIDGIDTTTEAGQDLQRMLLGLTGSMDTYYSSLESAQASISGNIGNLREQIYLDALGTDQNRYNYMKAQADNLAALLPNLFDVGAITDVTNRITQLSSQAYGLLDESGKNTNAQEMIDFLDKIQALANEQLSKANDETAQKNAEVLSVAIGDTLAGIREDFKRMLIENTSAQGAVIGSFDSIMQQTAMLVTQLSRIVQREVNA